ncbi:MAG: MOSC domain-containing protein YiiM [Gammaproteobacteria bacterium]|jgi:MOSC domain-containing protein YiiM
MSTLIDIAFRTTSKASMQTCNQANVSLAKGVEQDFRGSSKKRQVTVLSTVDWQQVCKEMDADLPWTTRRANLLVDELTFSQADVGKTLRVGDIELEITQETDPCIRMDEQHQGLKSALMPDWRGGVCCKVIKAGSLKVGDSVELN